jgi:Nif-specific regulatory protein
MDIRVANKMVKNKKDDIKIDPKSEPSQSPQLEAIFKISQIFNSGAHQKQNLLEVLDILDTELSMRRAAITLLSPDGHEMIIEAAHDLPDKQTHQVKFKLGEGITGKVVQTGKPMIVPKVSEEPLFLDRLNRKKYAETEISFLCVPISIGAEVIGTISVDCKYDVSARLEENMFLLRIVANLIANDVNTRRKAAIERQMLEDENLRLRNEVENRFRPENIIGNSRSMREVYRAIHQVAASDTTVLIRGESGTGKELAAHAIHYTSPRAREPFIRINCAALSENLLESELFGHEKGAFTGAIVGRKGRIEEAGSGTLFLDEIGDFSPVIQIKLLRVLQEREFERVGSNQTIKTNARIIAATNHDLEKGVEMKTFRRDLYYRINVFPIFLPPLRDRKEDILLLADYFVEFYARRMGKDIRRISTPAINMMMSYHWPGNVRELENCIERATLLSSDGVIHSHHLPPTLQTSDASDTIGTGSLEERTDLYQRDIIIDALKRSNGNLAAAARDLGTTARIIRYKVEKLDIDYTKYCRAK